MLEIGSGARCDVHIRGRQIPRAISISFLFLFAGREVGLPSRRRAFLAWGSGDYLDLFFLGFLFLPIAFLFASGHVNLPWLTNRLSPPGDCGLGITKEQGIFKPRVSDDKPGKCAFRRILAREERGNVRPLAILKQIEG